MITIFKTQHQILKITSTKTIKFVMNLNHKTNELHSTGMFFNNRPVKKGNKIKNKIVDENSW